jgi:hypothetical protein
MSDDKVKSLIHKIGLKYHIGDIITNKIINSQYRFVRDKITNLNIEGIETEEEFNKLKKNFIFLYLGKIYASYHTFKRHKAHKEKISNYHSLNKKKNE